jgi:threonine dehydrogenase-like Zn-dependent dehydrogenase
MSQTATTALQEKKQATRTLTTRAYQAASPTSPLAPGSIQRRAPRPQDVQIEILYCGVCHSDSAHGPKRVGERDAHGVSLRAGP